LVSSMEGNVSNLQDFQVIRTKPVQVIVETSSTPVRF
jgi:hypothetical protein